MDRTMSTFAALIEDLYCALHVGGALAGRMPEGREGEQRETGLVAEPARDARRLDRDLG